MNQKNISCGKNIKEVDCDFAAAEYMQQKSANDVSCKLSLFVSTQKLELEQAFICVCIFGSTQQNCTMTV